MTRVVALVSGMEQLNKILTQLQFRFRNFTTCNQCKFKGKNWGGLNSHMKKTTMEPSSMVNKLEDIKHVQAANIAPHFYFKSPADILNSYSRS